MIATRNKENKYEAIQNFGEGVLKVGYIGFGDTANEAIEMCLRKVFDGPVKVCDMCDGTGEVSTWYRGDDTGYNWIEDDTKPCLCQLSEANEE